MTPFLCGVRVLEFDHVWAGPFCGQVLADLGAEVIKIESQMRVDVHRRAGPYPNGRPGLNRSGVWNAQNRGKKSCLLNMKDERGLQLALQLIAKSDVVIENFTPGTLARLGLTQEAMVTVNPKIVVVSLSGYGQNGPWTRYPAYGPMLDAVSGLAWSTKDSGGEPSSVNGWFPDTTAALFGCIAALLGLIRSETESAGSHFDISQLEAAVSLLPELIAMASAGEELGALRGNEVPDSVFTDVVPCAGPDAWTALHVRTESEWYRLMRVLETELDPPDGHDLESMRRSLDCISSRTLSWDRDRLCERLQSEGVEAVPVASIADLVDDSHLKARGAFLSVQHPEVGEFQTYAPVIKCGHAPGAETKAAPLLGEDNRYVFGTLLGLSEGEQARLEVEKVIW